MCRKCVDVCPTHAIIAVNFPASKIKTEASVEKTANIEPKQEEVKA